MTDFKLAENIYTTPEQVPTRDGFGKGLVELGKKNPNVVVVDADLGGSTRTGWFKKEFPERFIQVGVAEQNLVNVAVGLFMAGKIPFVSTYGAFLPNRCLDMVRISVCYNDSNVKLAAAHTGISVGPDGATHQAMEDIATVRALPRMTVFVPCDWIQTKKVTLAAAEIKGPVFFRFGREKVPVITTEETPFEVGKGQTFKEGRDVSIISCGAMSYWALLAAKTLEKEGISASVINIHTIKPIDKEIILKAAKETGAIVTAEEHQVHGGFGSAVAEVIVQGNAVPMEFVAVMDRFGESGEPEELMRKFNIVDTDIVKAVKKVLARKK